MTPLALAHAPGSYRWYYVDVANDEWTAVGIVMMGSLFSPRFVRRPDAHPLRHAAVNVALYRRGQRVCWVLSEYADASLDGGRLCIGTSSFARSPAGHVSLRVADTTPWTRQSVEVEFQLEPACDEGEGVTLVPGLSHQWHPFSLRAKGTVSARVGSSDVAFEGSGYHDGNSGLTQLGTDLRRWSWQRSHGPTETSVIYRPEGAPHAWRVWTGETGHIERVAVAHTAESRAIRSGWGLRVERPVDALLLESSPFYARYEATTGGTHVLGETADLARFRSPFIRWMAHFRTRHSLRVDGTRPGASS